jgi:hypothetical protein
MVLHRGNDGDVPPVVNRDFQAYSSDPDLVICIWRYDHTNGKSIWQFSEGPAEEYPEGQGARQIATFYSGTAAWLFKNLLAGNALDKLEKGDNELFDLPEE